MFLKDFKVPATNNQAETDQRNIKIKQKTGKFRSDGGAEIYAIIRSCINTYKKQGINVGTGKFGAHMMVNLTNDGPVTILLESRKEF